MAAVLVSSAALVLGVGTGKESKSLRKRATVASSSRNDFKAGLFSTSSGYEKASQTAFHDLNELVSATTRRTG